MNSVMITGATSGLGLAIARALDRRGAARLILAVRDKARGDEVARTLSGDVRVVELDMASTESIRRLCEGWREPLHALVNNAGVQCVGPAQFTSEGVEATLAVNHLGPLRLTLGFLPWLNGGAVMAIGSGTHNPHNRTATMFGFRGARFTSIGALARGEAEPGSARRQGLDRYATSKLLAMATMMEMARRSDQTAFVTFDPGLMPGTGLLRTAPPVARLAWRTLLRWVAPLLPDSSTPERSAEAARLLLLGGAAKSGEVYDATGKLSQRVWSDAREPALGARILDESLAFIGQSWPD